MSQAATARAARTVYVALLFSSPLVFAILAWLRPQAGPAALPAAITYAVGGAAALLATAAVMLRILFRPEPADSPGAWWERSGNRTRALALWLLAEGAGVLAAVTHFLTGDVPIALLALVVSVAALVLSSPGRLEQA